MFSATTSNASRHIPSLEQSEVIRIKMKSESDSDSDIDVEVTSDDDDDTNAAQNSKMDIKHVSGVSADGAGNDEQLSAETGICLFVLSQSDVERMANEVTVAE